MAPSEDPKQEEQRQAQIMAEAIQETIEKTGQQFQTPMLNAVAGALVTIEAKVLASDADRSARKALLDAMNRARPKARKEALKRAGAKLTAHGEAAQLFGDTPLGVPSPIIGSQINILTMPTEDCE